MHIFHRLDVEESEVLPLEKTSYMEIHEESLIHTEGVAVFPLVNEEAAIFNS